MNWISVFDMRPAGGSRALCFRPDASIDQIAIRMYYKGEFSGIAEVTHWMPLPQPPQEEE